MLTSFVAMRFRITVLYMHFLHSQLPLPNVQPKTKRPHQVPSRRRSESQEGGRASRDGEIGEGP